MSNRMVSLVRSTGVQLVGQMADSFSGLASLSAGSATTSQGGGQQAGTAQQQSGESSKQQEEGSIGIAEQREKDGVEAALLEQLMQQHVHNIADFLLVVSGQLCAAAAVCVQEQEVVVYRSMQAASSHHIMHMHMQLPWPIGPDWRVVLSFASQMWVLTHTPQKLPLALLMAPAVVPFAASAFFL